MRTTAEAKTPPAPKAGEAVAGRRGRTAAAPDAPPPAALREPQSVAVTTVRMLRVDEGLHALRVGEITGNPGRIAGMAVPVAQVSAPFAEDGNGVEIVAAFPGRGPWLGKDGGTVILRSPIGGGHLMVTVYGEPGQPASCRSISSASTAGGAASTKLRRSSRDRPAGRLPVPPPPKGAIPRPRSSCISSAPAIACFPVAAGSAHSDGGCG